LGAASNHVNGDHAIANYAWAALPIFSRGAPIHIFQEKIEGLEPLGKPCLQVPFGLGHQPGNAVDWNYPLVSFLIPINGEGDALVTEGAGDPFLDTPGIFRRKPG
jgi:hypothetical protein